MATRRFTVEVQPDFLERQARATPIQAIAELIWNALDADATIVDVRLNQSPLGMSSITVSDNGHGIPYAQASELFTRLGGSWKKPGGRTKTKERMLHGYEGRGRFKVFALGRVADWHVTYDAGGECRTYNISMLQSNIREARISDEALAPVSSSGIEVTVSELHREFRSLQRPSAYQDLSEIFALYLKDYRDVTITYQGVRIDPSSAIASTASRPLSEIEDDSGTYSVELEIIEWLKATKRVLYLCTEHGFPLSQVSTNPDAVDFHFSAYLKSQFITELHRNGELELAEMNPLLMGSVEEAHQAIRAYFNERALAQARDLIDEWKEEHVYPYEGEAKSAVEAVERRVFDRVAVTASEYIPDFGSSTTNKAFHLRMLRTAIERSPEDLQLILTEVLNLPRDRQEELAQLLRETSLSAIIGAAKVIADRLKFLSALETIVFDDQIKKRLKERTQLHRILAENTWIFGEEFNISVSDRSLTEVLRKHRKLLGSDIAIDAPVKHISKKRGIIDLMLSRALRRHRASELDHLVVELKAPKVKIGTREVTQIEEYAISVAADERFRTADGVRWTFWVLSDEVDSYAAFRMKEGGMIEEKDNIRIGIKTWAQIIQENKARLQFFQEKLEYEAERAASLEYLQNNYQDILTEVVTHETIEAYAEDRNQTTRGPRLLRSPLKETDE